LLVWKIRTRRKESARGFVCEVLLNNFKDQLVNKQVEGPKTFRNLPVTKKVCRSESDPRGRDQGRQRGQKINKIPALRAGCQIQHTSAYIWTGGHTTDNGARIGGTAVLKKS
jgi:hypothetical protein